MPSLQKKYSKSIYYKDSRRRSKKRKSARKKITDHILT